MSIWFIDWFIPSDWSQRWNIYLASLKPGGHEYAHIGKLEIIWEKENLFDELHNNIVLYIYHSWPWWLDLLKSK